MDQREMIQDLSSEMDALIRLHRQGLYRSRGYQERRTRVNDLLRESGMSLLKEIDPVILLLYQRYVE